MSGAGAQGRRPSARRRSPLRLPPVALPGIDRLPHPEAVVRHTAGMLRERAHRRDPIGRSMALMLRTVHRESQRMAGWLARLAEATAPPASPPRRRRSVRSSAPRGPAPSGEPAAPTRRRPAGAAAASAGRRRRRRVPVD